MNSQDMIDVGESFERALQHVLNNTLGATFVNVNTFITTHVLRTKPWMMMTNSGMESITEEVLGNAELQDFMLELTYTFGSYWGASAEKFNALAEVLSVSLGSQTESGLPKDIKARTATPEQVATRLMANRWLMVLVLMSLFTEPAMIEGKKTDITGT